jgi:hypothetical protein
MNEELGDWCECCQGERCSSYAHFCDSCHDNGQADSFLKDEAEAHAEKRTRQR